MNRVMLKLGSFSFSIPTAAYDALSRSTAWNWAAQERGGRAPALQFTGKGEDKITLSGVIFTERAGLQQVTELRELGDEGTPQMLVDQNGFIRGKWCMQSIDESQSGFFSDGAPRKQEFTIQLSAYGEDA